MKLTRNSFYIVMASIAYLFGWPLLASAQTFTNHMIGSGLERPDSMGTSVIAVLDYNNDGYEDLIIQTPDIFAGLYRNNGNGTFTDVTVESNFPNCYTANNLVCFDIDNNGFPDIVIYPCDWLDANSDSLRIFMNYHGSFIEKTTEFGITNPTVNWTSQKIVPFDYNNDGYLDLLFTKADPVGTTTLQAYQQCQNGGVYVLVNNLNSAQPSFNTVVELVSYPFNVFPFGINVTDYNNDQKGDIVVCEQSGIRGGYGVHGFSLYKNNGNTTFTKVNNTNLAFASGQNFITVFDYNNDGLLDFINGTDDCCGPMKNTIWRNNGNGTFTDMSPSINPYNERNYYNTIAAVDFNNDGHVDISMNQKYHAFQIWENFIGTLSENAAAYGLSIACNNIYHGEWFDYNNDGALDLIFASYNNGGPNPTRDLLLQNPNPLSNKYLRIKLVGTESPRDGHGARVIVQNGTKKQSQYFSRDIAANLSNIFHFGLGQNSHADSVFVYWSSGNISKLANVAANQVLTITEPVTVWRLQITAGAGTSVDNENYLGTEVNATDGFDPMFDIPKPMEPSGNYIYLYFPHPEFSQPTGDNFACDIKAQHNIGDSLVQWNFDVKTNIPSTNIALNFISDGRIPSGFSMILQDLTLGTKKDLKKEGMSYMYNSDVGGIHSFIILIGDSISPIITLLKPKGGEIIRANQPYTVQWSFAGSHEYDSLKVMASNDSGNTYQSIASFSTLATQYTWLTPAQYLKSSYRVKVIAVDEVGHTSIDMSNQNFTIVGDSLSTSLTAGWNFIGTPLKPNDSTIVKIFGDDISEPFYVYDFSSSSGYTRPTWLNHGKGYWIGLEHNFVVDVLGAAVTDQYMVSLTQGFNIISNPLVVPVPKDSLKFRKDGTTVPYAQALTNGWIAAGMEGYSKAINNYISSDSLQIWNGYWLGVIETGVDMIITPPGLNTIQELMPKMTMTENSDWLMNIKAAISKSADPSLKFGMSKDAINGFDFKYDEPKAPAPPSGTFIETYFSHPDWTPILGSKFNSDIRSPQTTTSWTFYVNPSENIDVTLTWDAVSVPVKLQMIDNMNGNVLDLHTATSYTYTSTGLRSFTVNTKSTLVDEKAQLPISFALAQNYPNPFNPATVINYQLPVTSQITLRIYDVLGREVKILVDGLKDAGYYNTTFDGSWLTSGIYFARITATPLDGTAPFTKTMKMLMVK